MKSLKISLTLLVLLSISIGAKAQYSLYNEWGISAGPALINGDYIKNTNVDGLFDYDGYEINIFHSVQMVRERFGLKTNLGYAHTNNAYSKDWDWAKPENGGQPLLDMKDCSSTIITLGTQLEYDFLDFGMYYPRNKWTPYAAFGFNLIYAKSDVNFGENGEHEIFKPIDDTVNKDGIFTGSIKGSLGLKFRLSRFMTVFGELTAQRAFSDFVDGISPTTSDATDYISSLNIGVKYSIR